MTRFGRSTRPIFILVLVYLLLGCAGGPPEEEHAGESQPGETKEHVGERIELPNEALEAIRLETAAVEAKPLVAEIQATGTVEPNEYRLAHVSPRIAGKAIEVSGVLGQGVEPGQRMALLDSLELGERKSAYLRARADLEVARRNYEREARLFKERISSEREYLEAKGDFETDEAAYQAAREALHLVGLTKSQIEAIRWDEDGDRKLSYFPLVAPFEGTIIERHITIGELVGPEDKPFTIADLSTVWVLLNVYEKDLAGLREGAEARVAVDAYPGERFAGTVAYVSSQVDPTTRTAEARIEVENADRRLRPGMFARAAIASGASGSASSLVVPRAAVQRVGEETVVFVPDGPTTFEPREVVLGRQTENDAEIVSGLERGERVVTEGAFYLKSTLLKEEMSGHEH